MNLINQAVNFTKEFIKQFNNTATPQQSAYSFSTFGEPEPVLSSTGFFNSSAYSSSAGYYFPPVDFELITRLLPVNAYHEPIIHQKKNWLISSLETKNIPALDLERMALDMCVTYNAYAVKTYNKLGGFYGLRHKPALYMFRGLAMTEDEAPHYVQVNNFYQQPLLTSPNAITKYQSGEIVHIIGNPNLTESMYGKPPYLGMVQTALLGEANTLFKRRYYQNNAQLGFILLANDAGFSEEVESKIEQSIAQTKGGGNFRAMFLSIGRSTAREPIKYIPTGHIGTHEDIKIISSILPDEMCAAHQIPPVLACITPNNMGGFESSATASEFFYWTVINPLATKFAMQVNEATGRELVKVIVPKWLA